MAKLEKRHILGVVAAAVSMPLLMIVLILSFTALAHIYILWSIGALGASFRNTSMFGGFSWLSFGYDLLILLPIISFGAFLLYAFKVRSKWTVINLYALAGLAFEAVRAFLVFNTLYGLDIIIGLTILFFCLAATISSAAGGWIYWRIAIFDKETS